MNKFILSLLLLTCGETLKLNPDYVTHMFYNSFYNEYYVNFVGGGQNAIPKWCYDNLSKIKENNNE